MAVLAAGSIAASDAGRLGSIHEGLCHIEYQTWAPIWRKLLHVYEGSGGFLDGTYLVAHPREWLDYDNDTPTQPTKKLKARRRLARYENVAAPIIDGKRSALFRETPYRAVGDTSKSASQNTPFPIEQFWADVDGRGTDIDTWWQEAWTAAAVFGHVFVVLDQPQTAGTPPTLADIPQPYARLYTPLDVVDWLVDEAGELTAVRLIEAVPRDTLNSGDDSIDYRTRELTKDGWAVYGSPKGKSRRAVENRELVAQGTWNLGKLPVVVLYTSRRPFVSAMGRSVLTDPELYADLYNLTSEIRELLRNQTFGLLSVQLGENQTKEQAQSELGSSKGTENVLFTRGAAGYIQPETTNVTVYQEERQQLLRTIHRLTKTPYDSDSNAAASAESLEARRADFVSSLVDYADELERADYKLAELFYRMMLGPDAGLAAFERDEVAVRWPEDFKATAIETVVADTLSVKALGMGKTFMAEVKKRNIVPKFLPDIPQETADQIEAELDELQEETGMEALAGRMQQLSASGVELPQSDENADGEEAEPVDSDDKGEGA